MCDLCLGLCKFSQVSLCNSQSCILSGVVGICPIVAPVFGIWETIRNTFKRLLGVQDAQAEVNGE